MKFLAPLVVYSALAFGFACTPADRSANGSPSGGSNGSGGRSEGGSGGGENASGGQAGANDSGGTSGSGGDSNSGSNSGSGGANSGGSQGSGGNSNSGGMSGNGGGSGGSSGSGGITSTGTSACGSSASSNSVTFCNGLAAGALAGYGWVALGSADTLTEPTCDTTKTAITKDAPCLTTTNWSQTNALCMSGKIPALPTKPGDSDYASNWGVQIGVNAKDPNAAMGGSGWKDITFSVTGSPSTGLRALVHKSGDPDATSYCAAMTPGTALPLTTFNSKCWDGSGDFLTESDGAKVDKVSVQVSSTASEIAVSSLCLTKIDFGN